QLNTTLNIILNLRELLSSNNLEINPEIININYICSALINEDNKLVNQTIEELWNNIEGYLKIYDLENKIRDLDSRVSGLDDEFEDLE
ncbi:10888_t:CDS:2, partial [Funneliformis geosporum]